MTKKSSILGKRKRQCVNEAALFQVLLVFIFYTQFQKQNSGYTELLCCSSMLQDFTKFPIPGVSAISIRELSTS